MDDSSFIRLCQKAQTRVHWLNDVAQELKQAAVDDVRPNVARIRIVKEVVHSIESDLRALYWSCDDKSLDELERNKRLTQYSILNTRLQSALEEVQGHARQIFDENEIPKLNANEGAPAADGLFVTVPIGDLHLNSEETANTEPLEMRTEYLMSIYEDIKGLQQLSEEFATHVKKGGDHLEDIESNMRSTLLQTKGAREELTTASARVSRFRRGIIWGTATSACALTIVLLLFWDD